MNIIKKLLFIAFIVVLASCSKQEIKEGDTIYFNQGENVKMFIVERVDKDNSILHGQVADERSAYRAFVKGVVGIEYYRENKHE